MDSVKGFNNLPSYTKDKLLILRGRHMASLGTDYRESLGTVVALNKSDDNNVYEVHFANGKWWHYNLNNGTWY